MTIKPVKTGWQVNVQPGGRGAKRLKKTFSTKAEAIAWERHVQAKAQQSPDWAPIPKDARSLSDLADLWYELHGKGLASGKGTHRRLLAMSKAMGNPRAEAFTADMFAQYRSKRMADGITANNMNREQAYLRAVFNELDRLGKWKRDNPLKKLRAFKIQDNELTYLPLKQINLLLSALQTCRNKHVTMVAKVCLATGARWGEAEGLRVSQINGGVIQFVRTKSSKARGVPVNRQLEKELREHHRRHGEGEHVFGPAMSAFREGVRRAGVTLPKGQLTHVLRHTFASHFMMNGGSILSLQRALGHHSLAMTMRYAHLSPEHLAETRHLNPLAQLDGTGRQKTKQRRGVRRGSDQKHATRIRTLPVLCLPANDRRKDTDCSQRGGLGVFRVRP
ncbi:phage integrase [Paraburkholderia tropica]|uniref:phage integrase n=1 Tax=Paraburkholderia tropica TaxID=92647 RepID=UPI002AB015DE|nr:tyrosine-type recombinase/integrase [Paraburkholderia tropica]